MHNLTSSGFRDIFLAKVRAGGVFRDARAIGCNGNDPADTLFSDSTGILYVAGWFNTKVSFKPGTGVVNHTSMGDFELFVFIKVNCRLPGHVTVLCYPGPLVS